MYESWAPGSNHCLGKGSPTILHSCADLYEDWIFKSDSKSWSCPDVYSNGHVLYLCLKHYKKLQGRVAWLRYLLWILIGPMSATVASFRTILRNRILIITLLCIALRMLHIRFLTSLVRFHDSIPHQLHSGFSQQKLQWPYCGWPGFRLLQNVILTRLTHPFLANQVQQKVFEDFLHDSVDSIPGR